MKKGSVGLPVPKYSDVIPSDDWGFVDSKRSPAWTIDAKVTTPCGALSNQIYEFFWDEMGLNDET